jgi:hypothetical protein
MTEELTKAWFKGCKAGSEIVLEFLREVKNIDFEEEFNTWSNCDSYTNWKGEVIDKCGYGNHAISETEEKDGI